MVGSTLARRLYGGSNEQLKQARGPADPLVNMFVDSKRQTRDSKLAAPGAAVPISASVDSRPRTATLKQQVARGTAWNGVASACEMGLSLGTSVLLMRLLVPRDFGLLAAASVFVGLAQVIGGGGLGTAVIQRRDQACLYGSALFGNMIVLTATGFILFMASGPIAAVYGEPRLKGIVLWLAGGMVVAGSAIVPQAFLRREMRFRPLALISVVSNLGGAVAALTAAWVGAGVWALVVQVLARHSLRAAASWLCFPLSALKGASWRTTRSLLAYGYKAAASSLLSKMGFSSARFVIARFLGTGALGLYAAAWRLVALPLQTISGPVAGAAFPALCKKQDAKESLAHGYLQMVAIQCIFIGPPTVIIGVTAHDLVPFLAGDRWVAVVPVARVLAAMALAVCAFGTSYLVFLAVGKPEFRILYLSVRTTAVFVGAALGATWGLVGAAAGMLIGEALVLPLQLYLLRRALPMRISDYFLALARPAAALGILALASVTTMYCAAVLGLGRAATLSLTVLVCIVIYSTSIRFLCSSSLIEVIKLLPSRRTRVFAAAICLPAAARCQVG